MKLQECHVWTHVNECCTNILLLLKNLCKEIDKETIWQSIIAQISCINKGSGINKISSQHYHDMNTLKLCAKTNMSFSYSATGT